MTSNDVTQTRQAIAAKDRSGKLTVSGKLKKAIDAMLFEGSCRADAAKAAGMSDHGLREAFKKAHVKAYYNQGLEVLRTSERARNIKRLAEIRDAGNNMPAVQAVARLEQMADDENMRPGAHRQALPGLIVQINVPVAGPKPVIRADETIAPPLDGSAFGVQPAPVPFNPRRER
jgi:hypothetical protein